jgi:hypothetical protein
MQHLQTLIATSPNNDCNIGNKKAAMRVKKHLQRGSIARGELELATLARPSSTRERSSRQCTCTPSTASPGVGYPSVWFCSGGPPPAAVSTEMREDSWCGVSAETREDSWSRTARWSAVSPLGTSRRSCAATTDGAATRPGGSIEEQHCYHYSTSSSHPPMASLTEPHPPATASRPPRLPLPPLATAPPPHSSPQPLPSTRRGEIHRLKDQMATREGGSE